MVDLCPAVRGGHDAPMPAMGLPVGHAAGLQQTRRLIERQAIPHSRLRGRRSIALGYDRDGPWCWSR